MDQRLVDISDIANSTSFLVTDTNSTNEDPSLSYAANAAMLVEIYCMPVICLFGLVGNTLSSITFLRNPLRKTSCSLYLAVRSISDNGFLLALSLIWISTVFELRLSRVKGICQTIVFLTYICGCVSVWLVVFVTIENYVRICHPFAAKTVCSKRPARILTCILCISALGVYNFPLWISNSDCSHNHKFYEITQALVYTDTLLTLVIPSLLIIVLMIAILYSLIQTFQRRQRLRKSPEPKNRATGKTLPAAKVTKMLFVVSLMFFILNIPSHIIRLYILINSFIKGQNQPPNVERAIQTIFQLIYYLSFSLNIIIYLSFGRNFRTTFKTLFCRKEANSAENSSGEAVNMVPKSRIQRRFSLTVVLGSKASDYLAVPNAEVRRPASYA